MKHDLVLIAIAAGLTALAGCSEPDQRLADLAQKTTHEQSQQNQRLAEGSRAIAQGSQELVKADAEARKELVTLQQDLRQDQSDVAKQRDKLESERKLIARERTRESTIGSICAAFALILVCLAPLVLAGMSLLGLWRSPTPEEEQQVLIEELSHSLRHGPAPSAFGPPVSSPPALGLSPADTLPPPPS